MVKTQVWTLPESALESLADTKASGSTAGPAAAENEPPEAAGADRNGREPGALTSAKRAESGVRPSASEAGAGPSAQPPAGAVEPSAARERLRPDALGQTVTAPRKEPVREARAPAALRNAESPATPDSWSEKLDALKFGIHRRLIAELETSHLDALPREAVRAQVEQTARVMLRAEAPDVVGIARDQLVSAIVDEVLGLGPIEPLLRDPSLSEVMVNAPDDVYIERSGRLVKSDVKFRDAAHIMRIVDRILAPMGRRVDEASPMVDARLDDGSRVNVIVPPISQQSPVITIRKFKADKMRMADLIGVGALSDRAACFLGACVESRRSIVVSGGTGSGKTTLLNALSASIPEDERIVTVEEPAELRLQQPHVIRLEARPPSIEDTGEVTQRQILRNALRMRPDRIIIGECRGSEAFDMLQAMNTGHEGSLTTVHANSPRDALSRIENMVLMAGLDLPVSVVRQQIAASIHLVVQVSRFRDGSRKVVEVGEITGIEGDVVTMQTLFKFENQGMDERGSVLGQLRCQGLRPRFADEFELVGIELPRDFFTRDADLRSSEDAAEQNANPRTRRSYQGRGH
jgi:pilus assembly protein CpaF